MASAKRNFTMGGATQVFVGLGLGIVTGVFFGEAVAFLKVGGDVFIAMPLCLYYESLLEAHEDSRVPHPS